MLNTNLEAEQGLISVALMDPVVLSFCAADDIYNANNRLVWNAMHTLDASGREMDPVLIAEAIRRNGGKDLMSYVVELMDNVIPGDKLKAASEYAKIIKECSNQRRIDKLINEVRGVGVGEMDSKAKLSLIETMLQEAADSAADNDDRDGIHISEAAQSASIHLTKLSNGDIKPGLQSGFDELDKLTGGLHGGELIVIAGRPGMGKTSLATNIAENVMKRLIGNEEKVYIPVFSLEMPAEQLAMRTMSGLGEVDSRSMRTGDLSKNDFDRISNVIGDLQEVNIVINDTSSLDVMELRPAIRRMSRKHGKPVAVVIDYLQLLTAGKAARNRADEVSVVSRALKVLAKELDAPVIALAQLNRGLEQRADKRPVMSDLRESGAIEQDADVIMFVYRDEVYYGDSKTPGVAEVIIGKHRSGSVGTAMLGWQGNYTRFHNLTEAEIDAAMTWTVPNE